MARCRADRHQFRIAVSSDDAAEYEDLKPFVRRLMQQVERDLDTRLEWVAVDHFDTATPHSHIVLRGVDGKGKDLIIAREYLYQGMRLRSEQLLSLDLGPRTTLEVCRHVSHDPAAERLTELDVILSRSAGPDGTVFPQGRDGVDRSFQLARLEKLEQMGLADRIGGGRWQLAGSFGDVLREMGERGNIIRSMQQALTSGGISRRYSDLLIYRADMGRIVGQALEVQPARAHGSRNALIVDAVDGRTYYLAIGESSPVAHISTGAIVSIQPAHPPDAEPRLRLMSPLPLKSLPSHEGVTWLDQIIGSKASLSVRDAGFGRDVRKALDLRREWLVANGHALGEGENVIFQPGALEALRRRELHSVIEQIERETGLKAVHPIPGGPVEGKILRRIDMGPGMFAAVGNDRQFSIHPWSSALERQLEKQISFPGLELRSSWPIRTRDISI